MKLKYFLLVLPILFWVGCEDKDANGDGNGDGNGTVESVSGTYTLSSVIVHPGGDCSADDGTSGLCFPGGESESDCVETGVGFCMNDDGDGIEGIDAEADCTSDNTWVNMGWNSWMVLFSDYVVTLSDDGLCVLNDENCTWTLDGTTITLTESEGDVITGEVSGNTVTVEMIDQITGDADCIEMVLTK